MYRLDEDIEDVLHSWAIHAVNQVSIGISEVSIATIKGSNFVGVIWDKPDANRPAYPFLALNILSGPEDIGGVTEKYKELDTWEYHTRKKITVQANSYGFSNSLGLINLLINSTKLPSYRQIFQLQNLAFHQATPGQDLSEMLDTRYISRAQSEMIFSYPEILIDKPGEIHRVTAEGELENTEHIINIDETID